MRSLAALPKAHLHLHLDGSMRPGTLIELAERYGVDVPEVRGFGSFEAFAGMYVAAGTVLKTPEDLARLVDEVVEDAALDGAVWVEPAFYAPHHVERLGPVEGIYEIVLDALAVAGKQYGIGTGLIVSASRIQPLDDALTQAEIAARHADRGVVALGLANDETFPPEPFAAAFDLARDAGLLCTPHAGELAGPESVRGALDALGADRIQHGVRAIEDPELVQRLADDGICCDVCPTSNVMLSVVPTMEASALGALLDAGVACSVNADDSLLFGPGLLDEYEVCRAQLGFDDERMAHIARCSIEASGAPESVKSAGRAAIRAWLAEPAE